MANVSSSNGLEKRPKLRFPGFDEPWKLRKLNDMLNQRIEKQIPSVDAPLMAFTAEGGVEPKGERYDRSYLVKNEDKLYKRTEYNDFIYSSNNLDVGSIGLNRYGTAVISDVYEIFSVKSDYLPTFVSELIQRPQNMKKVLKYRQGCLYGQYRIYAEDFLSVPVFVPTKQEQEKISQFLDSLDKRIAYQRSLINNLKKYKRGVTAKLITAIEEKYPVVKLGNHVAVMRGGSPRPIDAYITNAENGIRWIKIGDALPDQLYISDTKEKIKPEGAKKSRRVYAGDLILSNSMSFGRPYILKVDGCIHDGWLLIRDEKNNFDKRFLCFYLASDSTLAQYKKFAAGSCVNNLNSELVANVEIGMPPIEQQIHVADILEKIDRQVEAASTMYLLLSKLRSSLLQQLFI